MMVRARWKRLRLGRFRGIGGLLTLAFALNAGLVGLGFVARAQEDVGATPATETSSGDGGEPGRSDPRVVEPDLMVLIEEVQGLADDLNVRRDAIEKRHKELDEREAALDAREAAGVDGGNAAETGSGVPTGDSFRRLVAAFESMEPETSASALIPLYGDHPVAAIDIILAISSRQAGAVMDAIAATAPATAASISHDIYVRSPPARNTGG